MGNKWSRYLARVEAQLDIMPQDSDINKVRRIISDACRDAASRGRGVYRLNVPTGSGKTLTSLRYALAAAAEHDKKRIIFVIPLLSVLENNAKVIRDYISDDEMILEHHSNIILDNDDGEEYSDRQLLLDSWDSPIIITTLVQLLNTLFAGKTSCIRRMHALVDSVIVIDEVQTVPRKMLSLFTQAINFLTEQCGTTVVLCTATQPALEAAERPLRYSPEPELFPHDPSLWSVFKRTELIDRRRDNHTPQELADFAVQCLEEEGSVLVICNTKSQARQVFKCLPDSDDVLKFHLSTSMCVAHRTRTLEEIKDCLNKNQQVICVSTQLVEAGVDFSFGCVIRVLAGLDNIIQAAGRCNRSGEYAQLRPVYVTSIKGESLRFLKDIQQSQNAASHILERFEKDPESLGGDLTSQTAIEEYYKRLYMESKGTSQDYYVEKCNTTIFDMLSGNRHFSKNKQTDYILNQAFKTAGEHFKVFDDNTIDIIVPFCEGAEIITNLCGERAKHDLRYAKDELEKAKKYSVSIYNYELNKLQESGGVMKLLDEAALAVLPEYYSEKTGFSPAGETDEFLNL